MLTSYGVLRSDAAELAEVAWDAVALDEAQQIKNPDALGARAARALKAELRVAMTGTPVENRLDEMWSLLAFTNPGLLGSRARFRRRFSVAVEQRRSQAAARRLHEIVGPHILRRRKADVAPELPPKIEATVVCALTDEQERLYRAGLDEAFDQGLGAGMTITRPDPMLPRARSLARSERVRDLELTPGEVTASVHDRGEHRVRITTPRWDDAGLATARRLLAGRGDSADLPDSTHAALRNAGLAPAPAAATLTTTCSCTGRRKPCLHLVATYFELARRLDERPHLVLALRGLTDAAAARDTARIPLCLLDPATFYRPVDC